MRLNKFLNEKKVSIDAYDNPRGETATVKKVGKGFYVDVGRSYDRVFKNKKELNKWLKLHQMEYVGTDLVNEQVYVGRTTEDNEHSHGYRVDAIGSGFTTFDNTKHIHAIGVWKCKTAHGHEHEILDLIEAKKIVRVKKPDFMVAMGLSPDYSVKEIEPDTFHIAKFTHGKEPAEVYRCQWTGKQWKCNCYSRKGSCKHVNIVQKFIKGKKRNVFDKWAKEAIPKK